ncbi:unnamed protein product [Ceratitis capitata]|uniref:(Mediterranean fruit fly) hypothetical protein n=1 Tax=Ceratitis capitata TaxID=7213 RepID=A0A811U6K0_CERCA|nr:unnamed protein product [Ceratitis capitata]
MITCPLYPQHQQSAQPPVARHDAPSLSSRWIQLCPLMTAVVPIVAGSSTINLLKNIFHY